MARLAPFTNCHKSVYILGKLKFYYTCTRKHTFSPLLAADTPSFSYENATPLLKGSSLTPTRRKTMRTQFSKIALAATLGFAMAFTFSCSSDKDDGGNNNGGGGGSIVNADNEAWVLPSRQEPFEYFGGIFKQSGEYIKVAKYGGNWYRIDYDYIVTYSISGNKITLCYQGNDCDVSTYSISGNTLIWTEEDEKEGTFSTTLTRTSGVYIIGNWDWCSIIGGGEC